MRQEDPAQLLWVPLRKNGALVTDAQVSPSSSIPLASFLQRDQSMQISSLKQKQAAELLGVTARSLRDWPDAPRNEDGTYPGAALVAWWLERHCADAGQLDLSQERARLAKVQADRGEVELAVRCGELLERSRVIREVGAMLTVLRDRLLVIPDAINQRLDRNTAQSVVPIVRQLIREALTEVAAYQPQGPSEE